MKSISKISTAIVLMMSVFTLAQVKNAKTETVKIYGNCKTCKSSIEKAGNEKNVSEVSWNEETKMATLTYDATKTKPEAILKKIAYAGYDSDSYFAPDDAYAKLASCCQYKRNKEGLNTMPQGHDHAAMTSDNGHDHAAMTGNKGHDHAGMTQKGNDHSKMDHANMAQNGPLDMVQKNYFAIKDALVKDNSKMAAASSATLIQSISKVEMGKLAEAQHNAWMKQMANLNKDAKTIAQGKDIKAQREAFKSLSKNMYEVLKAGKSSRPVYYQHCPMQNANWLSLENTVKNPYYGAQMLTCGSTVETLK